VRNCPGRPTRGEERGINFGMGKPRCRIGQSTRLFPRHALLSLPFSFSFHLVCPSTTIFERLCLRSCSRERERWLLHRTTDPQCKDRYKYHLAPAPPAQQPVSSPLLSQPPCPLFSSSSPSCSRA
jgi:hypothetical protein